MKIYQIDCSARKKGSASRDLAKKLLDKIKKPEDKVTYRDLDDEMLFVAGLTESGMSMPENERTEHGRFVYLHGAKDNIKHVMVKYTDVYAPVVSTKSYSMFAFLNADHPNTEIDEVFEELSLEETLKHHGG